MDAQHQRLVSWTLRVWLTIGAGLLLAGFWWLFQDPLRLVVPPLLIAGALIYLLNPAVSGLHRAGLPRPLGTLVTYVGAVAAGWAALALLGPLLVEQARELVDELPGIGVTLQRTVNAQLLRFGIPESSLLDLDTAQLAETVQSVVSANRDQVLELLRGAGSVVSWVVHLALAVTLGPILAFYALSDLPRMSRGAGRLLPPKRRGEVLEIAQRIARLVGSYFRGQLVVATFVGVTTALGLWLIGLPFWAIVGITTGIFNLVPFVGPTAGGVFGVLIALTVGAGLQQAVLVVVVMVAVQQVDNHLITPLVVSRSVAIHPITVILALLVAGSLGGIPLMFVAIPGVAALKLLVLHVAVTRLPSMSHLADELEDGASVEGRGTVTALAQELRRSFERRLAAAQAEGGVLSRIGGGAAAEDEEPGTADDDTRAADDESPVGDDDPPAGGVTRAAAGAPPR